MYDGVYNPLDPDEIMQVVNGTDTRTIWERPKVREMTVEQIEKALGYEVKIIGDKENA